MTAQHRKLLKEARKKMIDKDLTTVKIAEDLGTSRTIISQLINGHNYYPRYAEEMLSRYGIFIPDARDLRRAAA